jgi:hypothetical protein
MTTYLVTYEGPSGTRHELVDAPGHRAALTLARSRCMVDEFVRGVLLVDPSTSNDNFGRDH